MAAIVLAVNAEARVAAVAKVHNGRNNSRVLGTKELFIVNKRSIVCVCCDVCLCGHGQGPYDYACCDRPPTFLF